MTGLPEAVNLEKAIIRCLRNRHNFLEAPEVAPLKWGPTVAETTRRPPIPLLPVFLSNRSPVFFIEFISMTLVNKSIQVSSVQVNKTSSAHCIVRSLPQIRSLSVPIYPPFVHFHLPHPPSLSLYRCPGLCVIYILLCLIPSPFFISSPTPSPVIAVNLSYVSMLLFLFCLLNYFVD